MESRRRDSNFLDFFELLSISINQDTAVHIDQSKDARGN